MPNDWPKIGDMVDDPRKGQTRINHVEGPAGRTAWRVRLADGQAIVIERSRDMTRWVEAKPSGVHW